MKKVMDLLHTSHWIFAPMWGASAQKGRVPCANLTHGVVIVYFNTLHTVGFDRFPALNTFASTSDYSSDHIYWALLLLWSRSKMIKTKQISSITCCLSSVTPLSQQNHSRENWGKVGEVPQPTTLQTAVWEAPLGEWVRTGSSRGEGDNCHHPWEWRQCRGSVSELGSECLVQILSKSKQLWSILGSKFLCLERLHISL